jgi:hypothetical protein
MVGKYYKDDMDSVRKTKYKKNKNNKAPNRFLVVLLRASVPDPKQTQTPPIVLKYEDIVLEREMFLICSFYL